MHACPRRSVLALLGHSLLAAACGGGDSPPTSTQTLPLAQENITPSVAIGRLEGSAGVDVNGNATYHIPIDVAPGIGGMAPSLSLDYSSGGGDGFLGAGWRLTGLSSIAPCSMTLRDDGMVGGPQEYRGPTLDGDPETAICLDGERLVLVDGDAGEAGAEYRLRRDPYTRIELHEEPALHPDPNDPPVHEWWKVYARDGLIYTYGRHEQATVEVKDRTYRWALQQVEDRFENHWRVEYDRVDEISFYSNDPNPQKTTVELLPVTITYTYARDPEAPNNVVNGDRYVRFVYADRPLHDQYDIYSSGALERLRRRLWEIRVEAAGEEVRRYRLEYRNDSASGRSLMRSVAERDAAGVWLPPTNFTWQLGATTLAAATWPGVSLGSDTEIDLTAIKQMLVLDADHDGHDELMFTYGEWPYAAEPWQVWDPDDDTMWVSANALGTRGGSTLRAQVADFNGDAYPDVVVPVADTAECGDCLESDDEGIGGPFGYATRIQVLFGSGTHQMAPIWLDDDSTERIYHTAFGDFDGDGLTDVSVCRGADIWETQWYVYLNRPGGAGRTLVEHDPSGPHSDCSYYEWFLVLDGDGDGADELYMRDPLNEFPDDGPGVYGPLHQIGDGYIVKDLGLGGGASDLPIDVNQHLQRDVCHPDAFVQMPFPEPSVPYEWLWPQAFPGGPGPDKVADVNGDGLDDIVRLERAPVIADDPDSIWTGDGDDFECDADTEMDWEVRVWLNTGHGHDFVLGDMVAVSWNDLRPWEAMRRFEMLSIADVNFDRRADVIAPDFAAPTGDRWEVRVAQGGPGALTFQTQSLPLVLPWDHDTIWQLDGNDVPSVVLAMRAGGSALTDLVGLSGANGATRPVGLTATGAIPDHIEAVHDGLGGWDQFDYGLASDHELHVPGQTSDELGLLDRGLLVREHRVDLGLADSAADAYTSRQYIYYEGRHDRRGRGNLGFSRRTVTTAAIDPGAPLAGPYAREDAWYDRTFDPTVQDFPRVGRAVDVVQEWKLATPQGTRRFVHYEHDEYEVKPSSGGSIFAVHTRQERRRQFDIPSSACADEPCKPHELDEANPFRDVTTTRTIDAWGNTEVELTKTASGHEEWVTTTWENLPGPWLIGRATKIQHTSEAVDGTSATRTLVYAYVGGTHAIAKETIEPNTPAQRLDTTYLRDARGLPRKLTTENIGGTKRTTELTWDDGGYFVEMTKNPLGQLETFVHHPGLGVRTHYVDVAETVHESTYDGFGRRSGSRRRAFFNASTDGADVTIDLLAPGPVAGAAVRVREARQSGGYVLRDLDRLGRQIRAEWVGMGVVTDGTMVYQTTDYDDHGKVKWKSVPQWVGQPPPGYVVSEFDHVGRITSSLGADGARTTWSYDGLTTTVTDAESRVTTYNEDEAGDVVSSVDADSTMTCFDRGPFGLVAKLRRNCGTNSDGPKPAPAVYTYDRFGRPSAVSDPITGARAARYDSWGNRTWTKDAKGQEVNYGHDALGRVVSRSSSEGLTTYTWDGVPGQLASSVSFDGVERRYEYDDYERPTALEVELGAEVFRFELTYDLSNRIATVAYPTGPLDPAFAVAYGYDAGGYLRTIDRVDNGDLLWRAVSGTPRGSLATEEFGDTTETRHTYDVLSGRLTRLVTDPAGGVGAPLQDDHYAWTATGDLDWRRDDVNGQLEDLTYDGLHRLRSATATKGSASRAVTVRYDRLGNITTKSDVGAYAYDVKLRLASAGATTFTWDANGDVASRNGSAFTFTTFGKVRTIASGNLSFLYDADGERVQRTDGAGAQHITIDDMVDRRIAPGEPVVHKYFVKAGKQTVAQVTRERDGWALTTTVEYFHADHLGTPVLVTDELGTPVQRMSFDPWGARRHETDWTNPAPFAVTADVAVGFTGHPLRTDGAGGLIDMGARLYEPKLGRFVSPDPIVGELYNGQAYTPYVYVLNNPLSFVDPTGMQQTDPLEPDDGDGSCEEGENCDGFPDEPVDGDLPEPGGGGPPPGAPGPGPFGGPPEDPTPGPAPGGEGGVPEIPMPTIPLPEIPMPGGREIGHGVLGAADGYTFGGSTYLLESMGFEVPTDSPYFIVGSVVAPGAGAGKLAQLAGKAHRGHIASKAKRAEKASRVLRQIHVPFNKKWAEAVLHALEVSNPPMIFTVDRVGKTARRRATLKNVKAAGKGRDRDEWPMAVFVEGACADVRSISSQANRGLGAYLGNKLSCAANGDSVEITFADEWYEYFGFDPP